MIKISALQCNHNLDKIKYIFILLTQTKINFHTIQNKRNYTHFNK